MRVDEDPLTLTGMILHLGLSSRESLDEYGRRPEFSDSVKRAKLLVENQYERKLDGSRPTGAIFALKNMGWADRQEVEVHGMLRNLNLDALPDHLIARLAAGENPYTVLASAAAVGSELLRLAPAQEETGES